MILDFLIVIFIGAMLGSFASAITYRIPRHIPWFVSARIVDGASGRWSHCPSCKTRLTAIDLIPVISWIKQKGRCRHCSAAIPPDYPLIEGCSIFLALLVYGAMGVSLASAPYYLLIPFLIALVVIDLRTYLLPNQLVAIIGGLGLVRLVLHVTLGLEGVDFIGFQIVSGLIYGGCAWLLGAAMSRYLGREALGFGDVKFFAVAGLWLGIDQFPQFLMISGLFGIGLAVIWKKVTGSEIFPFGPALIASFFLLLLFSGSHFY